MMQIFPLLAMRKWNISVILESTQKPNALFCAALNKSVQTDPLHWLLAGHYYVRFYSIVVKLRIIMHYWKRPDTFVFIWNDWNHCHILFKCEAATAHRKVFRNDETCCDVLFVFPNCSNIDQPCEKSFISVKICKVIVIGDLSSTSNGTINCFSSLDPMQ